MAFREMKNTAQMWRPWWYMWLVGDLFLFLIRTQNVIRISINYLETLSMTHKSLKMLLNISGNVIPVARLS